MAHIVRITDQSGGYITRTQLDAFTFDGHAIKLIDPSRGIRNPAMLPATLSILTNPRSGYADQAGPDGFPRHSIRTGDWAHARLPQTPHCWKPPTPMRPPGPDFVVQVSRPTLEDIDGPILRPHHCKASTGLATCPNSVDPRRDPLGEDR
jgi:hypothetical protein